MSHPHADSPHPRLPRRAAAARGQLQVVGRQVGLVFDSTIVARRDRRRHHRLRRGLPARARSTCPPMRTASRAGIARARAAPARPRSARARRAQPPHGRRAQGPSLREVGDRHRLLGHPRQGDAACRSATLLGGRFGDEVQLYRAISQESPDAMAASVARLSRRGLSPLPAQGRRRSRTWTSPASAPCARELQPGDRAGRRRQHRLAHARGGARRPRRCATSTSTSSSPA